MGAKKTKSPKGTKKSGEKRYDDSLWKDILSRFFVPMLQVVLPEMAREVDMGRPVTFLDKELRRLARYTRKYPGGAPDSGRFVDMLADVPLLSGEHAWILLHAEVQGSGGHEDFSLRMHRYRCLLESRYNRSVAGLAFLTEPLPVAQAGGRYSWERFGSKVTYEYPTFKIYEGDEEILQQSENPFDLAHYAAMQAWKHRRRDARKLLYMKTMLNILDERGWNHEKKAWLLWFIEGIMHIDDDNVWEEWEHELDHRKEEASMYISLMERKGMKKGVEKGIEKGIEKGMKKGVEKEKLNMARRMLEAGESEDKILLYTRITPEELRELREKRNA
ncbi:MAG TPA: hypothetical protein PK364_08055 [Synergistaceae bacterium]|nr:hypothetical protein [Synergistaceae bacterium]HPJ26692.1 hypothetical protein [Synergistaceae bacterium]